METTFSSTKQNLQENNFSNLTFLSNYTIKTVERTYSLRQSFETIQLLSKKEIDKNKDNFSFIHIDLVQVAVKPLTRQGLNTSVSRIKRW